jgi:hypothetical protein
MKAVRFVGAGYPAQVVDIPTPIPGPGEILVKIGGAGGPACAKSAENCCVSFRPEMPRIIGGLARDGGIYDCA